MSELHILHYVQSPSSTNKTKGGPSYIINNNLNDPNSPDSFSLTKVEIKKEIRKLSENACLGYISKGYLNNAFEYKNNNMVMLMYTKVGDKNDYVGFILAKSNIKKKEKKIHLDVICSKKGYGGALLNFFLDYVDSEKYTSVHLDSLPHVLTYYPKFDFKHRASCDNPEVLAEMPESLKQRIKDKKPLPVTSDDTYDDDDYVKFMLDLHKKGFGKKDPPCDGKLTRKRLKEGDCGSRGYSMYRCKDKEGKLI